MSEPDHDISPFADGIDAVASLPGPSVSGYDPGTGRHWVRPWKREQNPSDRLEPFVLMEWKRRWLSADWPNQKGSYEDPGKWHDGGYNSAFADFGIASGTLYTSTRHWAARGSMRHPREFPLYGPYCRLPGGNYDAYYLVWIGDDDGVVGAARIDVTNNNGQSPYGGDRAATITREIASGAASSEIPLYGGNWYNRFGWYRMPFSVGSTGAGNLEFRVRFLQGCVAVMAIQVWRKNR